MKYIKPYFYDSFQCKADKCTDSCCIGWEIDIDSDSLALYERVSGDFGQKLKKCIDRDGENACFQLSENERCPFLDEIGLCEIYQTLGEDSLCDICREHPRFYSYFKNRTECGLGLCCEKVCELLFGTDEPLTFHEYDDGEPPILIEEEEAYYLRLREEMFAVLADRSKSFAEKAAAILLFAAEKQGECAGDKAAMRDNIDESALFEKILHTFSETEPINEEWTSFISTLCGNLPRITETAENFSPNDGDYTKLLTYILYRHFVDGCYEQDILAAVTFAIVNVIFVYLCECYTVMNRGVVTLDDRIFYVKLWSKQIEYSDRNVDYLLSVDWELFHIL